MRLEVEKILKYKRVERTRIFKCFAEIERKEAK